MRDALRREPGNAAGASRRWKMQLAQAKAHGIVLPKQYGWSWHDESVCPHLSSIARSKPGSERTISRPA